jgi:hypothetical protein
MVRFDKAGLFASLLPAKAAERAIKTKTNVWISRVYRI